MPWWTREEMESILLQLEDRGRLFDRYHFTRSESGLSLIGQGAYAYVFEAEKEGEHKGETYAIQVIGFGNKRMEADAFQKYMEMQWKAGIWHKHVVKLWDYKQIIVRLDGDGNVISDGECEGEDGLRLQLIVMEKLDSVIRREASGAIRLYPEELRSLSEEEILRLACDIGQAIQWIHKLNIIHRDIKLENIFYDTSQKCYKLGDFGIAREMEQGGAVTMAYTNGYGAPEVMGRPEELYDCTADLYSFGILLYVLLNGLRFPGSEGYFPNASYQYTKGAAFQRPETGSDSLCAIVLKLCAYDPEDRYQSMKEVMQDLKKLCLQVEFAYWEENAKVYLALGIVFLLLGLVLWILRERDWLMIFSLTNAVVFILRYSGSGGSIDECRAYGDKIKKQGEMPFWANILYLMWGILLNVLVPEGDSNGVLTNILKEGVFARLAEMHLLFAGCIGLVFWGIWWVTEKVSLGTKRRGGS